MTKTITIRIDVDLYKEIEAIAEVEHRNMNGQLIRFIELGKERYERQKKALAVIDEKIIEDDSRQIEKSAI